MATQFVKWWKTKFHAGCAYKTISVLGSNVSDGRPSDTEDLVRDDTSSYNNGAHVNPGLASSSSSENSHDHPDFQHEVKFEDFECNVHVEESESGEERKEFSFTFYDLDGYGKVTKDDVAGLVRSIYGAVNESIKVPQGGKKTIKVKLTVSPEKSKSSDQSQSNNNNNNNLTPNAMGNSNSVTSEERPKLRNNFNVTIQENLNKERPGRREKDLKERLYPLDKPKFNSVRLPNSAHAGCRGCRNFSPEVFRDCSASPLRNRKKWRERACSLQRPDLLDLIQANMEKNNVSPCCRHEHTHHQQHSLSQCTHNLSTEPGCPVFPLGNEYFWKQKLADISHKNSCNRPPINLGVKMHDCHAVNKGSQGNHHMCKKNGHHRSRSHDLSQNLFRYHLLSDRDQLISQPPHPVPNQHCCNNYLNTNIVNQEECVELLGGCILNQHISQRNKNTNIINSASPHQLKHRNREQEHARAMAQVINWLERENIGGDKRFPSPKKKNPNPNEAYLCSPPVVKKHEHRHVHEHIHHHYHHYGKETPIIV